MASNLGDVISSLKNYVDVVKERLEKDGVSKDVIERAFYGEVDDDAGSVPQGRFLKPNPTKVIPAASKTVFTIPSMPRPIPTPQTTEGLSPRIIETTTIIRGYSPKVDVLVGPFNTSLLSFKKNYLEARDCKLKPIANAKLGCESGTVWMFFPRDTEAIKSDLRLRRIKYEEEVYQEGMKVTVKDGEPMKVEPEPAKAETKIEPPKVEPVATSLASKFAKNKYNNSVLTGTNIVIMFLNVTENTKAFIAIGVQDTNADENLKGFKSILPLPQSQKKHCESKNVPILNEAILNLAKIKNPAIHRDLAGLMV